MPFFIFPLHSLPLRYFFISLVLIGFVSHAKYANANSAATATTADLPTAIQWNLDNTYPSSPVKVWLSEPEASGFKAFKAEVTIDASMQHILAILADTPAVPLWYCQTKSAKIIKQLNANDTLVYSINKMPWPVSDRDAVMIVRKKFLSHDHAFIELIGAAKDYPHQNDYIRIKDIHGYWKLDAINDKQTKVTHEMHADPSGNIPAFMANLLVVDMPVKSLTRLKILAEQGWEAVEEFQFNQF